MRAFIEVHTDGDSEGPQLLIVQDIDALQHRIAELAAICVTNKLEEAAVSFPVEFLPETDSTGSGFAMRGNSLHVRTYSDTLPEYPRPLTSAWIEAYSKYSDVDSEAGLDFDTEFWQTQIAEAKKAGLPYVVLGDGLDLDALRADGILPLDEQPTKEQQS